MACKNKSVRFFLIFFLISLKFPPYGNLSSNCLLRNTFPNNVHHVPKDKSSRHFSQLLLPLWKGIKE